MATQSLPRTNPSFYIAGAAGTYYRDRASLHLTSQNQPLSFPNRKGFYAHSRSASIAGHMSACSRTCRNHEHCLWVGR
jgi:hypothetical protein